jgi:SAM-dependent methyltransferase
MTDWMWGRSEEERGVPTSPDDPRLLGWYHTIELAPALVTKGDYDHRPVIHCYGLPESLEGKTALDVGTCDGFWAFELERRGAKHVVAVDVESWGEFDWLPSIRASMGERADYPTDARFRLAHQMLQSRVEHRTCNVYDLSPETAGVFDIVFCGDVLQHLQNPIKALVNIRSVTREMAIVATIAEREIDERFPEKPWLAFGHGQVEEILGQQRGEACIYWHFSGHALREALAYAGFAETRTLAPFALPSGPEITAAVGYSHAEAV